MATETRIYRSLPALEIVAAGSPIENEADLICRVILPATAWKRRGLDVELDEKVASEMVREFGIELYNDHSANTVCFLTAQDGENGVELKEQPIPPQQFSVQKWRWLPSVQKEIDELENMYK